MPREVARVPRPLGSTGRVRGRQRRSRRDEAVQLLDVLHVCGIGYSFAERAEGLRSVEFVVRRIPSATW